MPKEAALATPAHIHAFAVDAECECGVSISGLVRRQAAEIAALKQEREEDHRVMDYQQAEIGKAETDAHRWMIAYQDASDGTIEANNVRLREALRPFAEIDECGLGTIIEDGNEDHCSECGQVLAARAALAAKEV